MNVDTGEQILMARYLENVLRKRMMGSWSMRPNAIKIWLSVYQPDMLPSGVHIANEYQ